MRCGSRESRGGEPALDGRVRARPRLGQGKQGGGACPLHGSAAGLPRPPHSPRPRSRAAAATVTAAVSAAARAAAPSATATPDDDRAAILGAMRQRRKAAPACGTTARSQRRPRSGIAPSQSARRKPASERSWPRDYRRPLRRQRRRRTGGAARKKPAEIGYPRRTPSGLSGDPAVQLRQSADGEAGTWPRSRRFSAAEDEPRSCHPPLGRACRSRRG